MTGTAMSWEDRLGVLRATKRAKKYRANFGKVSEKREVAPFSVA